MSTTFGTAAAAKFFLAVSIAQAPTVIATPEASQGVIRTIAAKTQSIRNPGNGSVANVEVYEPSIRDTTPQELLIGELRNWASFDENWDGEGAAKPNSKSILDATLFARLLDSITQEPEPMLLASGHAALFWNESGLYADLEFLGNNRIAYFVQKGGDKHKGVASFGLEKMPAVFQALLCS